MGHGRPATASGPCRAHGARLAVFLVGVGIGVVATLFSTGIYSLPFTAPEYSSVLVSSSTGLSATVVIMHFKRTENVKRIVSVACQAPSVTEVLVWDGNSKTQGRPLASLPQLCGQGKRVRVVSVTEDFGLQSRYTMALLATNDVVVIQDDDLEISPKGYEEAVLASSREPWYIHGPYGRWPTQSEPYETSTVSSDHAPIILTKFLVAHRTHFAEFFKWAPQAERLPSFAHSVPRWNGEDILLSLATLRHNEGRLHRLHSGWMKYIRFLAATDAIGGQLGTHHAFRRKFVSELSEMLGLQWPKSRDHYPNPLPVVASRPIIPDPDVAGDGQGAVEPPSTTTRRLR